MMLTNRYFPSLLLLSALLLLFTNRIHAGDVVELNDSNFEHQTQVYKQFDIIVISLAICHELFLMWKELTFVHSPGFDRNDHRILVHIVQSKKLCSLQTISAWICTFSKWWRIASGRSCFGNSGCTHESSHIGTIRSSVSWHCVACILLFAGKTHTAYALVAFRHWYTCTRENYTDSRAIDYFLTWKLFSWKVFRLCKGRLYHSH